MERRNVVKRGNFDNKATAGCFVLIAVFILAVAIGLHNEEKEKRQNKQEITYPTINTSSTDDIHHKKENIAVPLTNSIATIPATTSGDDENDDDDLLENPDFDDLIPGDEYDEEFVDRSTGDPELYDENF